MEIGNEVVPLTMKVPCVFTGLRVLDGIVYPLTWNFEVEMVGISDDPSECADALNKILYWLETSLDNIAMFSLFDHASSSAIAHIGNVCLASPDDASDDVIVQLLHSKINALGNGAIHVGRATLSSTHMPIIYTYEPVDGYDLPASNSYIKDMDALHETPWWDRNDGFTFELLKLKTDKRDIKELYKDVTDPLEDFHDAVRNASYTITGTSDSLTETTGEMSSSVDKSVESSKIIETSRWNPKKV